MFIVFTHQKQTRISAINCFPFFLLLLLFRLEIQKNSGIVAKWTIELNIKFKPAQDRDKVGKREWVSSKGNVSKISNESHYYASLQLKLPNWKHSVGKTAANLNRCDLLFNFQCTTLYIYTYIANVLCAKIADFAKSFTKMENHLISHRICGWILLFVKYFCSFVYWRAIRAYKMKLSVNDPQR